MEAESPQPKGRESIIAALNAAIEAMKLAEKISSIAPAKTVFSSVNVLLTQIMVYFSSSCNDLPEAYI